MTTTSHSRVHLNGLNQHDCGYCKGVNSSKSYGIVSDYMQVRDYESLMLTGWRRSGSYLYRPLMYETCCPAYTIRLSVEQFRPSKSQRKVDRKVRSADINITVDTERPCFSEEKFRLYQRYQVEVHHDNGEEVTPESFTRFLVTSPLVSDKNDNNLYGTFHQNYRIDGKLIAVAVLDILPSGVSSVYFFYDVDFKHLSLGKFSALQEIEFSKSNSLDYYYMGFYIHNCDKMKYKGEYQPSDLLCPTTMTWIPFSEARLLLDQHSFTPLTKSLAEERSSNNNNNNNDLQRFAPRFSSSFVLPVEQIRLLLIRNNNNNDDDESVVVVLDQLSRRGREVLRPLLEELLSFTGPVVLKNLLVCFG